MAIKNKKSLLIVDDEEGIRESLALAFEIEGYPVYSAGDGNEALDKIKKHKIDVVIRIFACQTKMESLCCKKFAKLTARNP